MFRKLLKIQPSRETVFISIASFCDNDLEKTIENILATADFPDLLRFGICMQDTPERHSEFPYKNDNRFRVLMVPADESKGCCWARRKIQELYRGEKYYMQLDAHMRMVPHWDTLCRKWLRDTANPKAVLTSYLIAFDKTREDYLNDVVPYKLSVPLFYDNDKMRIEPQHIDDYLFYNQPISGFLFSAHFVFTDALWMKDVPYDEELYFEGEEDTLSVRTYTNGWDIYHPHRAIGYHFYTRTGEVKHHDVVKSWGNMHEKSLQRMRIVLGMEEGTVPIPFGLGKARTLDEYQTRFGIHFKERKIKGSLRNEMARKKLWTYPNGGFKRVEDGKWHEYKGDEMHHEFHEIEHNEHQLLLHDANRNLFVKIENNKSFFRTQEADKYGEWVQFNNGLWNGELKFGTNSKVVLERLDSLRDVFNKGQTTAMVSLRTPNTASWANYAAVNQLAYATNNNHTFYLYKDLVVLEDIPHWNKVRILMHLLPLHEVLIWIDSDAIITNPSMNFESIIESFPEKSLFVCNDIGGWQLNTGVMILRNTRWMREILKSLWEMDHIPHSKAAEQSSLIQLLALNDSERKNWHIFDQRTFNCHPRAHQEGDFILHMMGLSGEERQKTFDYWNKKTNVYATTDNYNISQR